MSNTQIVIDLRDERERPNSSSSPDDHKRLNGQTIYQTIRQVQELVRDGHSNAEISRMMGRNTEWVSVRMALAALDINVIKMLDTPVGDQYSQDGRKLRRRRLLTITTALQIVKLNECDHLPFAQMVIEKRLHVSDIRRLVRKKLKSDGRQPVADESPEELFASLDRRILDAQAMVHLFYHEMDLDDLRVRSISGRIASRLNVLARELIVLAQNIDLTIDPSTWNSKLKVKLEEWRRNGLPEYLCSRPE